MGKRIIQTKRDREIIAFLEKGFYATSEIIDRIFFNSPVACRRRLVRMTERKWIERERADESTPYVYFIKPENEAKKQLLLTQEDRLYQETEQNKRLFLSSCLSELKQKGNLVFYAKQYSLTTSVADLLVVMDIDGIRVLIVADVFNRDGSGNRHKTFFSNSVLLRELTKTYHLNRVAHLIFAERVEDKNDITVFIRKETGFSYRDYRYIEWSKELLQLEDLIKSW